MQGLRRRKQEVYAKWTYLSIDTDENVVYITYWYNVGRRIGKSTNTFTQQRKSAMNSQ